MFRKLLVPLDRSALAEQALGRASAIARAAGASIDVVLVHDTRPINGFVDADAPALRRMEHDYVAATAAEIASGASLGVTHTVLEGEPVDVLCRYIWENNIDLVVMTSHGRTGFNRCWLGSVADGVVHQAAVPVVLLRPTDTKQRTIEAHHLPRRILVPLDGSASSTTVLPAVASLARCSGARVTLLRIVQPAPLSITAAGVPVSIPPIASGDPETRRRTERAREWLAKIAYTFQESHDLDVDARLIVAPAVAPAILEFARDHDISLIALSTRAHGVARLFHGSVADKVLRASELPMLLFHAAVAGQTSDGTTRVAMSAEEAASG